MTRIPAITASLFLPLALAAGLALAASPTYAPDDSVVDGPTLEADAWIAQGPGFRVRIRQLDEKERQAYFAEAAGSKTDPFATRPDQDPRFMSFLLELDNRTDGSLTFQPQNCWLMAGKPRQVLSPIGLEELGGRYAMLNYRLPPAYEQVRPVLLEASRTVAGGERLSGLLVYPVVEPKTKKFRLDIRFVLPDGNQVQMIAPFRRVKEKRG